MISRRVPSRFPVHFPDQYPCHYPCHERGYSPRTATEMAFDLLRKHEIKSAIELRKAELMAGKKMTHENTSTEEGGS